MRISFDNEKNVLTVDGINHKVTPNPTDNSSWEIEINEDLTGDDYVMSQSWDIAELLLYQIQDEYDHNIIMYFNVGVEFSSETPYEIISDERESNPKNENAQTLYYSERAKSFMIGRVDKNWDYKEVGKVDIKTGVSEEITREFEEKLNNYYNGRVYEKIYRDGSIEVQIGN